MLTHPRIIGCHIFLFHAGVYLEQGHAEIVDSNVSSNTLTGVSAIGPENVVLNLRRSDLVSNGSIQLEMPPPSAASSASTIAPDNNFRGEGRFRSGLVASEL